MDVDNNAVNNSRSSHEARVDPGVTSRRVSSQTVLQPLWGCSLSCGPQDSLSDGDDGDASSLQELEIALLVPSSPSNRTSSSLASFSATSGGVIVALLTEGRLAAVDASTGAHTFLMKPPAADFDETQTQTKRKATRGVAHKGEVLCACEVGKQQNQTDGFVFATGGEDGCARFWRIRTVPSKPPDATMLAEVQIGTRRTWVEHVAAACGDHKAVYAACSFGANITRVDISKSTPACETLSAREVEPTAGGAPTCACTAHEAWGGDVEAVTGHGNASIVWRRGRRQAIALAHPGLAPSCMTSSAEGLAIGLPTGDVRWYDASRLKATSRSSGVGSPRAGASLRRSAVHAARQFAMSSRIPPTPPSIGRKNLATLFSGLQGRVETLTAHAHAPLIAAANATGTVAVWTTAVAVAPLVVSGKTIAWSPHAPSLAVAQDDRVLVHSIVDEGRAICGAQTHEGAEVVCTCWCDRVLVAATNDGTVLAWQLSFQEIGLLD